MYVNCNRVTCNLFCRIWSHRIGKHWQRRYSQRNCKKNDLKSNSVLSFKSSQKIEIMYLIFFRLWIFLIEVQWGLQGWNFKSQSLQPLQDIALQVDSTLSVLPLLLYYYEKYFEIYQKIKTLYSKVVLNLH